MRRTFIYALGTIGRWAAISSALSVLLFLADGTTHLNSLRNYLAAFSLMLLLTMFAVDPGLAQERAHPGRDSNTSHLRVTSGFFFLFTVTTASVLVGRTPTLIVPTAIRWIALAIYISSSSLQTWAMIANPFFSPVVRIQTERGHKLIDSGPYRFVRHPGYLAMSISVPASAVAIGSWLALTPAAAFVVVICCRAQMEDRFLHMSLPSYRQYAQSVPAGLPFNRSS